MKFKVKVIANSSRDKIEEAGENVLKIHLTSPPVRGRANKALIKILSDHFKVKKSEVKINKGLTSNIKEVEIIKQK